MMAAHSSEIKFKIGLDEDRVPETLEWSAEDGGIKHSPTRAAIISVWDPKTQETLRIDLWTKKMTTDEMKKFIHQSMMALADTLEKATNESESANEIRQFGKQLGQKMNLLRK